MSLRARFKVSITLTETRKEDPRFLDLAAAEHTAMILTDAQVKCVTIIDTELENIVFRSADGKVRLNNFRYYRLAAM